MVDLETAEKIHLSIEKKLATGSSYIDALVEYAKEQDLEVETVGEIVEKSTIIKEKIRAEAKTKRLLKGYNDTRSNFFD
jgi:UDP-glucose 6-dehydrogenase